MARGRRGRSLSLEEEKLWSRVKNSATPLEKPTLKGDTTRPEQPGPELIRPPAPPIPEFRVGQNARPSQTTSRVLTQAPVRMDQKAFTQMKRGRLQPEARIDLHGMTQAAAHPALIGFILRAQSEGKRLVLVITGKGRTKREDLGPIPEQSGVLRRQVPHWLETPPLNRIVLQVTPAHQKHGGSGAVYVYLRRR